MESGLKPVPIRKFCSLSQAHQSQDSPLGASAKNNFSSLMMILTVIIQLPTQTLMFRKMLLIAIPHYPKVMCNISVLIQSVDA